MKGPTQSMVSYESRAILPSLKRVLVDPEQDAAKGDQWGRIPWYAFPNPDNLPN